MDEKEINRAIYWAENCASRYAQALRRTDITYDEVCPDTAVEALERQLPRKVTLIDDSFHCPYCGSSVDNIDGVDVRLNWCNMCGQRLDWTEVSE